MMNILSVFSQSPFNPIREHIKLVSQSVALFSVFLDTLYEADWEKSALLQAQLNEIDSQASYLKQQVFLQLPTQIFEPLNDVALFGLLNEQHKVLTIVREMANTLLARKMKLSTEIAQNFVGFVYVCLKAMETAQQIVDQLENLVAKDKSNTDKMFIASCLVILDDLVRDAQQIHAEILGDIFTIEKKLCPIEAGFLYKIIDEAKKMMSNAQNVGYQLQLMVL